ncbi:hypothetical protein EBQ93_00455, partial [bacterium]|nr:hypothetical protein [bacterium]
GKSDYLTGTYTVVKDDLNSRSNYTYPKGTYNGQDVFVYIAKTKNDALGTVVGTISADELGTLKSNNSSNASISASFSSDPKYLADGGFVYSLTSSGSTTTPSASYYVQSATAGTLVLSTSSTTTYPQGTLTLDGTSYNVIVQPNTLSQPSGYTLPFVLITGTDYQNVVKSYNTLLPADAQYANVFQVN